MRPQPLAQRYSPVKSIYYGFQETVHQIKLVFVGLSMLIHREAGLKDMAGPIGIVQMIGYGWDQGLLWFLKIVAMISISLGVFNLFPIPVLDGGHLMFLGIEAVRRKPIDKKWEMVITNVGASVLIGLMVVVVLNDLVHWQSRVELLKRIPHF